MLGPIRPAINEQLPNANNRHRRLAWAAAVALREIRGCLRRTWCRRRARRTRRRRRTGGRARRRAGRRAWRRTRRRRRPGWTGRRSRTRRGTRGRTWRRGRPGWTRRRRCLGGHRCWRGRCGSGFRCGCRGRTRRSRRRRGRWLRHALHGQTLRGNRLKIGNARGRRLHQAFIGSGVGDRRQGAAFDLPVRGEHHGQTLTDRDRVAIGCCNHTFAGHRHHRDL